MKVLIYCRDIQLYKDEFNRRFAGKFKYMINDRNILWDNMRIMFVINEPRGYKADIVIGFNQDGVNLFTNSSCINIKEMRTTTYLYLLDSINDDGSFNWEVYLQSKPWRLTGII